MAFVVPFLFPAPGLFPPRGMFDSFDFFSKMKREQKREVIEPVRRSSLPKRHTLAELGSSTEFVHKTLANS